MEDLRLVGLSEDGSRLVLEGKDGRSFAVPVDERIHAALRGDRARLGQLQINMESRLRPREIQARIRAGQSSEEVAVAAGVPVDRVRRYEGPILLERTHMAESARAVGVRRVTDSTSTPLGTLVATRLEERGVSPEDLEWDSWRREDARWEVLLRYSAGGRERLARWIFDPARRTIEPDDDESRWLTDEERAAPEAPRKAVRRLAPVPSPEAAPEPDEPTRQHDTVPVPVERTAAPAEAPAEAEPPAPKTPAPAAPAPAAAPAAKRPSKRAAVPSWDEILFGMGSKDDDSGR
jgi:hypothetical protein